MSDKPKRLRCRASVLPAGEWHSRQCQRAATGTHDMWERGVRKQFAACTQHQRSVQTVHTDDGGKWSSRPVQEYMA